jgi:tetratricopeptide (TPR) repeat protein
MREELEHIRAWGESTQSRWLDTYLRFMEGEVARLEGNLEDAVTLFEQGTEDMSLRLEQRAGGLRSLGLCLRALGQAERARDALEESLNLNPFSGNTHYELALVYEDLNQRGKAQEHLQRALSIWEPADEEFEPSRKARRQLAAWTSDSR